MELSGNSECVYALHLFVHLEIMGHHEAFLVNKRSLSKHPHNDSEGLHLVREESFTMNRGCFAHIFRRGIAGQIGVHMNSFGKRY
jgi:hypothetical protein